MARRKPPKIVQMGYSGVSERELDLLLVELEERGAHDIDIQDDPDTMRDFPNEGNFFIVDYYASRKP